MSKLITTPIGTAVYPHIDNPDTKFDDDGVYTCKLHLSEGDFNTFKIQYDALYEKAYKAECASKDQTLRKSPALPVRITDAGDYEVFGKQAAKRNTSKGLLEFSVAVYDSAGNKLPTTPRIGSGSKLRLSLEPSFWYVASSGFGCTLRLRAVQVIDLVEYGGGGSSEAFGFEGVDGGFVGDDEPVTVGAAPSNKSSVVLDDEETYDF
jgi:hypothetical protein